MPRRAHLPIAACLAGATPAWAAPGPADLARAYPAMIRQSADGWVVLSDGTRWPVAGGTAHRAAAERLARPDIAGMFADPYPPGTPATPPRPDQDPGRVRFQPLFDAMYGDCTRGQVAPRLRRIAWLPRHGGGSVLVTTINGVADRLEAVSRELDRLAPTLIADLVPAAGTYACRSVAGTTARSMHAYGAAIDIATRHADYWRWAGPRAPYRNRIPLDIVRIFERHGFIWGGK